MSSLLPRSLALAAASLLIAGSVQAAGPLQSELLHLDLPLLSASAQAAPPASPALKAATASSAAAAASSAAPAPKPRSRADVIAELRAARANGELRHAEAEIGWPVNGRAR